MQTAVTGIKPTGIPHLGNYLGMYRPALELARDHQAFYFVADYHAMTLHAAPPARRDLTYQIAANSLALGKRSCGSGASAREIASLTARATPVGTPCRRRAASSERRSRADAAASSRSGGSPTSISYSTQPRL